MPIELWMILPRCTPLPPPPPLTPKDVLIDGIYYFSLFHQDPWDCNSVLTTYSNIYNNPVVVGRSNLRGKGSVRRSGGGVRR